MKYCFPKFIRLRKRSQYQRLASQSKRYVGNWVIIEVCLNQNKRTRLGITVSKRFGKAHERNRFKRIVREAFRLALDQLTNGIDINIRPLSSAKKAKSFDIHQELLKFIGT